MEREKLDFNDPRRALITRDQFRQIFMQEFAPGELFSPTLDPDGNIFISIHEIYFCTEETLTKYPFLGDLEIKYPQEILKTFSTEKEWIEHDKTVAEQALARAEEKLVEIESKESEVAKVRDMDDDSVIKR